MTKKRQLEATDSSSIGEASKKSNLSVLMSYDEVAVIIRFGDSEKLREIIESGRMIDINMNDSSNENESLLMIACKSGFIDCARVLIDNNADLNYSTRNGSVLKSACLSDNVDMLKFVIERGATFNDNIILCLFKIDKIVCNNEIAITLVGHIQDVNHEEGYKYSLLSLACRAGNVTIVRFLLERGAKVGYSTSFVIASELGNLEVVKLLLEWQKNDNTDICKVRVRGALKAASEYGHLEVIRCLIEYGTDVVTLNSALYDAIEGHQVEIAAYLLDTWGMFSVSSVASYITNWMFACLRGSPDIVRLFLDRGADPNGSFTDGSTALLELVRRNSSEYLQSITVLLEYGADPNLAHATTGETALMIAALDLHIDLVELLLVYEADVTQVNREGKSVLDILGRTHKYGEVVELCTQYIECNKPGAKQLLK